MLGSPPKKAFAGALSQSYPGVDFMEMTRVRCQRYGCDAMFTDDENTEDSCKYHDSAPIFHDGTKEWSCCKQRSHDFSFFLALPGCKTGKHTTEKPIRKTATIPKKPTPLPTASMKDQNEATKMSCLRCQQGFFCSDHGSQPRTLSTRLPSVVPTDSDAQPSPAPVIKKIIDLNEPQTCRNNGCSKIFKEKDNHDSACEYHPGPPVFHDRSRGWKCCDIHVKEFDEFVTIPPCTKGWHNANPES